MWKQSVVAAAVLFGCDVGDHQPRSSSALVPLSYELPDGDRAVAGWYNRDDETITLSEDLSVWGAERGTAIRLELDQASLLVPPGDDTVETPLSLDIGDDLLAHAGDGPPLALIVEDADFTGAVDDLEVVKFGDGSEEACDIFSSSAYVNARIKHTGWGCGHASFGTPGEAVVVGVDDTFTDGACVQVWVESNAGNWFYGTRSCGAHAGRDVDIPSSGLKRVRMFLGGSRDKGMRSSPPPGRYQTLCGPGSGLECK